MSERPTIISAPIDHADPSHPNHGEPAPGAPGLPSGTLDVIRELTRAVFDLVLMPARALIYLFERRGREQRLREDLECQADLSPLPTLEHRDGRALLIFIACAEASGEKHAANLVDAIRELERECGNEEPRFIGLGGAELAARGVELIGDPVSRAAMGFDVFSNLPFYFGLIARFSRVIQARRPDLFLPVDSPALHVPLAHIAKRRGVPVVHFVTPQYWGWAPWRVRGYRSAVDLALCILPFEQPWFERQRVRVAHVGHPLLDELSELPVGETSAAAPATPTLALLPGSRRHVVERNLPWMLRVLVELRTSLPGLSVVIPQNDPALEPLITELVENSGAADWVRLAAGELHTELSQADAAFSVSGTILIDLLHERLPTVVLYRLSNARQNALYQRFLTCPYFSSVNLVAGREILPEFCFYVDDPNEPLSEVVEAVRRSLGDTAWRTECLRGLEQAAERLGPPGAVDRAARHALSMASPVSSDA